MNEEAVLFGEGRTLSGIVTDPEEDPGKNGLPAFIFLNSGVIHRIGPNRLSVRIARELARIGYRSFRIDFSGIGESLPDNTVDRLDIKERWMKETREAIAFLEREKGDTRFILIGNCSGAALSFFTACSDPRVIGTVLINLPGPKIPLRYYLKLAFHHRNFRSRLLKFNLKNGNPLQGRAKGGYGAAEISRDLRRLTDRGTKLLLVFCEWDPGFAFFSAFLKKRISAGPNPRVEVIRGLNHDFDLLHGQEDLIRIVRDWAPQVA